MTFHLFNKNRPYILYGISLAMLLFMLKWLELRFVIFDHSHEIYAGAIAVLFTALGIWLATKLIGPKTETIIIEKEVVVRDAGDFTINTSVLNDLKISKRELEVLERMSKGLSNREIAEDLFVSLNTVKTHGANLFEKLEVKRRTQAIEKAKRLSIIP